MWTKIQVFVVSSHKMEILLFLSERQQGSIQKCNLLGWFCFLGPILFTPANSLSTQTTLNHDQVLVQKEPYNMMVSASSNHGYK